MNEAQWRVGAASRQVQAREGAELEYPGRTATCPRGHSRVLPTRFSRAEFQLRCHDCGRSYTFRESPQ